MNPSKFIMSGSILSSSSSSSSSSSDADEEITSIEEISSVVAAYRVIRTKIVASVEESGESSKHGGSKEGRKYFHRNRKMGHNRLFADYFAQHPVYPPSMFRRRFRMSRELFMRILYAVESHNSYFIQKTDACHVIGLSPLQKMTASIRMLAYGISADLVDEYVRIGESTVLLSLTKFCRSVIEVFEDEYLRSPTESDIARLLSVGEARGFPGMLGSLDCMHWQWKNCPTAWQGQYSGHVKKPTIILEAIASYDLWIWHAFFGMSGSHNDLNVLDRSHLFSDLTQGRAPMINYSINGHNYDMGYYLADGIYPKWTTLVQTISSPQGAKKQYFAQMQESARKDVERAFGVLQSRFAIVRGPARSWSVEMLGDIMKTCIILHNMIIEDERNDNDNYDFDQLSQIPEVTVSREPTNDFQTFLSRHVRIRDSVGHYSLRDDLIEHLWQRHGDM